MVDCAPCERGASSAMRYQIEFMIETTEEHSVCSALKSDAGLAATVRLGFARAGATQVEFGAGGFQVRDLNKCGRIVAIEEFVPMGHA